MKSKLYTALLCAGSLGFVASGYGQANPEDLIIGFRDTTGSVSQNLQIDLGSAASLVALSGGSTVSLLNLTDSASGNGILGTDALGSSTINSIFGGSWASVSNITWGVAGAVTPLDPNPNTNTFWVTATANTSTLTPGVATALPYTEGSTAAQGAPRAKLQNIMGSLGFNPAVPTVPSFVQESNTAVSAWTKSENTGGGKAFTYYTLNKFETNTNIAGNLSANGNNYVASDLFVETPADAVTPAPAAFVGTFSIDASGNLDFTAVPEPSTYAAILGAAVLGVVLFRSRRQTTLAL